MKKNLLLLMLSIWSALLYVGFLAIFGKLLANYTSINYLLLAIIFTFISVIFIFINLIASSLFEKKLKKMSNQDRLDFLLKKKEWLKNNVDTIRISSIKNYKKCFIYGIFNIILLNIALIFSIAAINNSYSIIPFIIQLSFTIPLLIIFFYSLFEKITNKKVINKKSEYPILSTFVNQIFKDENVDLKVNVEIIHDANCSINKANNMLNIYISWLYLKFLSNEELKAILIHEIAHFKNKDLEYTSKIDKMLNSFDLLFPRFTYRLVCPFILKASFNNMLNDYLVNEYFENKADDEVLNKHMEQSFVNATIKTFGIERANRLNYFNIDYQVMKNKKFTDETILEDFSCRLNYFNKHKDFFVYVSNHHLPERFGSHPNIHQRKEKCHVENVQIDINENHYFDKDIQNYYQLINNSLKDNNTNDESSIKRYEQYLQLKNNFDSLNVEELNDLADAAFAYGDYDIAKNACYKALSNISDKNRVNYILGTILLNVEYNKEGIEYLNNIINVENNEFKVDALQSLGEYYSMIGDEENLNYIRNIQVTIFNQKDEFDNVLSLKLTDNLTPYTNEEVKKQIINILKDNTDVTHILIGVKTINNLTCNHVIVLLKNKVSNSEKVDNDLHNVFKYLDVLSDQFNLLTYPNGILKSAPKLFKKSLIIYQKGKENE